MTELGLIQVYTGDGKGKTTASLGLAFRALGHGFKVAVIQFMKGSKEYGELKISGLFAGLEVISAGRDTFVNLKNPESIDCELAGKGWELAQKLISSGEWDIVILDEINVALAAGLIKTGEVASFLKNKKNLTEVVLTGRNAPPEIIEAAHLVTEMKNIRHPFDQNVSARQGIEY